MKASTIFKTVIAVSAFSFASVSMAGSDKEVIYSGDQSAKSICTSIANDQVSRLDRALDAQKVTRLDNRVYERFNCNSQDLLSFAEAMNADKSANYLAKKLGKDSYYLQVVSN